MQRTGNSELDAVLLLHKRTQYKRTKGFAVLRWSVTVDYYDHEALARKGLAAVPPSRRVGLVDRKTGATWCRGENFRLVMETLRLQERTAPKTFRRT